MYLCYLKMHMWGLEKDPIDTLQIISKVFFFKNISV